MAAVKFRMQVVKTPEDVDGLNHLSAEEIDLAKVNLRKVPPTDGWWILGNDPELQAFWQIMERDLTALLHPDFQGTPFTPLNLITLQVARILECEYLLGVLVSTTVNSINHRDLGAAAHTKLSLLAHPESAAWSEEERVALKFAQACLDRTMSDELFQQAVHLWGAQKTLRHISWVAYVNQWVILEEALGMRYVPSMLMPDEDLTPEIVEGITDKLRGTRTSILKLWDELPDF